MRIGKTGILAIVALSAAVAASVPASAAPRGGGGFHGGGGARMGGGGFGGAGRMGMAGGGFRSGNFAPRANFGAGARPARFAANPGWNNRGWRQGGDWRHRRQFGGFGVGFATGALLGSAPYWGSWGPYAYDDYAYYDDSYDDGYGYGGGAGYVAASGADVQYCMQRFRSYDPSSGTYLGYDGLRHSCP